jgi:hypothetical protein
MEDHDHFFDTTEEGNVATAEYDEVSQGEVILFGGDLDQALFRSQDWG